MSTQQIVLIAVAALLVFWALGAHNRVVALRNRIGVAFVQLDDALQRRAAALASMASAVVDVETRTLLDATLAAQPTLRSAADALRARPALADRAAALAAAEQSLASDLEGLMARLELHRDGAAAAQMTPQLTALHDARQRLAFGRQLYNDAVDDYNAAARQIPTRWLSSLFGFAKARTL